MAVYTKAVPSVKCRWAPPTLVSPTTILLENTAVGRKAIMDPTKDYIVVMPSTPVTVSDGVELNGGRNVVLIGGEISFPSDYNTSTGNRAMFIKGNAVQTVDRVVHVEGVRFSGLLKEGINIDSQSEPGLTVRFQNVWGKDELVGSLAGNHADFIQVYNGPTNLQVDRCQVITQYQGFFFGPHQFGTSPLGTYEIRRTYIEGTSTAGALAYIITGSSPSDRPTIITDQFYVKPGAGKAFPAQVLYENPAFWGTGVVPVTSLRRSFLTGSPGINYCSFGYES